MHDGHGPASAASALIGLGLAVLLGGYLVAVLGAVRRGRSWPWWRTGAWCAGVAAAAHHDFTAHMVGHLLIGMLAPLLLVLAAPVTVVLRALPARRARTVSRVLHHRVVRALTHPVTATLFSAGGLWLLYTTGLYEAAGRHDALHALVHAHVLLSGYVFTAAIVGVDPAPGRPGFAVRAAALVAFLAAHGVLAKFLYARPPAGVPAGQAESASMLMYYGGDVLDLAVIALLCRQWYVATRPRPVGAAQAPSGEVASEQARAAGRSVGTAQTTTRETTRTAVDGAR